MVLGLGVWSFGFSVLRFRGLGFRGYGLGVWGLGGFRLSDWCLRESGGGSIVIETN